MIAWSSCTTSKQVYRKHRRISRTFLPKIFASNWGCGLSARTSGHHAVNLHKLTLFSENLTVWIDLCSEIIRTSWNYTTVRIDHFTSLVVPKRTVFVWAYIMIKPSPLKELLTSLTLCFLSSWTSLGRESPFRLKVVYSVDDGCSNWEKSNPTRARKGSEIYLVSSTPSPYQMPGY